MAAQGRESIDANAVFVNGDWARHSARRVVGPQSPSGRDTLRDTLRELGFELR